MSASNENIASAAASPGLLLWLRPRAAMRAVLASGGESGTIAITALYSLLSVAGMLGGFRFILASTSSLDAAGFVLILCVAAALGVLLLYVGGFLTARVAGVLGGQRSSKAARAALSWSAPPAVAVAAVSALHLTEDPAIAIVLGVATFVAAIWQVCLATIMTSEALQFGKARAFGALLIADVLSVGIALALVVLLRFFLFQPFNVPSGGMIPSLEIGDHFFVSKFAYGYGPYSTPLGKSAFKERIFARTPQRGDVVVFRAVSNGADHVDRIIGLPGDRIQLIAGRLYINGELVPRRPVTPGVTVLSRKGEPFVAPTYIETLLGGVEHKIVEMEGDHGINDNTGVFLVPLDSLFVLGDNRDNSSDSRIAPQLGGVGFVPLENLIGRADMIYKRKLKDTPEGEARFHLEWVDSGLAKAAP